MDGRVVDLSNYKTDPVAKSCLTRHNEPNLFAADIETNWK